MKLAHNITDLTRLESNKLIFIRKIINWGLLPREGDYKCPKCGEPLRLFVSSRSLDGYEWNCSRFRVIKKERICHEQVSLRKGTFFDKSHLTFLQILGFITLWMDSCRKKMIKHEFRLSLRTVVNWASFCREVVLYVIMEIEKPIGGDGKIVELEEYNLKNDASGITQQNWAYTGIERGSGKVFMVPVQDRTQETLINLINKWILPGTKIISSCWDSYNNVESVGNEHETLEPSIHFVDPRTGAHTNNFESVWCAANLQITPSNSKPKKKVGNVARLMLKKKAKAEGLDPALLFFKMAGQLYNPLVDREIEIRRPEAVLEGAEEEDEEEEEEEDEEEVEEEADEELFFF